MKIIAAIAVTMLLVGCAAQTALNPRQLATVESCDFDLGEHLVENSFDACNGAIENLRASDMYYQCRGIWSVVYVINCAMDSTTSTGQNARKFKLAGQRLENDSVLRLYINGIGLYYVTKDDVIIGKYMGQSSQASQTTSGFQPASQGQKIYDEDQCIGAVVNGICHGSTIGRPKGTCHGKMLNGRCIGVTMPF